MVNIKVSSVVRVNNMRLYFAFYAFNQFYNIKKRYSIKSIVRKIKFKDFLYTKQACWFFDRFFNSKNINPNLKSEKIGDYSYTNFEASTINKAINICEAELDKWRRIEYAWAWTIYII